MAHGEWKCNPTELLGAEMLARFRAMRSTARFSEFLWCEPLVRIWLEDSPRHYEALVHFAHQTP